MQERGRSITVKLLMVHYSTRRYRRKKMARTPSVRCMTLMTETRPSNVISGSISETLGTQSSRRWLNLLVLYNIYLSFAIQSYPPSPTYPHLHSQWLSSFGLCLCICHIVEVFFYLSQEDYYVDRRLSICPSVCPSVCLPPWPAALLNGCGLQRRFVCVFLFAFVLYM